MEAPRGAREPTGTNGPTPHQPPPTRHPPPQTVSAPPQKGEGQGPPAPHTEQGPARGDGQPDTPHPRRAHKHGPNNGNKGGTKKPQPLYEPRPTHPPPRHTAGQQKGGRTTQSCGGHSTGETPSNIPNLEAKPGRANGTAPQGVRESRKPPQHTTRRGAAHTSAAPPHTRTHTHARTRPRNNAGTQHARQTSQHTRTRTQARPRGHTHADPTPTTPTRERAPAHTSPTHAQRRAPGRPIAPALLPA